MYLVLVLPALLFTVWAQYMVSSSFKKFSKLRTLRGITGADAAGEVLRRAGVHDVRIEQVRGNLTDHYDPRQNVIRLSESVYGVPSVAAVGVAAHEAGHALQYASGYFPIRIRAAIIPVTNIGSKLAMPLVLLGLLFGFAGLINIGIVLFGAVVVFQLLTLPVEFNASRRAIRALEDSGALGTSELPGARKVLTSAAMTYVAALAVSLAQLLRLIGLAGSRNSRR
jgi:Zn-dependent membrane protease YugP